MMNELFVLTVFILYTIVMSIIFYFVGKIEREQPEK